MPSVVCSRANGDVQQTRRYRSFASHGSANAPWSRSPKLTLSSHPFLPFFPLDDTYAFFPFCFSLSATFVTAEMDVIEHDTPSNRRGVFATSSLRLPLPPDIDPLMTLALPDQGM